MSAVSKNTVTVNLLNGSSAVVSSKVTFNELQQKAANADRNQVNPEQLEIYGKCCIDLEKYGDTKICDYRTDNGQALDEINIGLRLRSGTAMGNVQQIDQGLVDSVLKEPTSPSQVLRGYTGHIPGRTYSYGLAASMADRDHMFPPEIAEKETNGVHYGPDLTLGYKGFIRGSQHIAGRTYRHSLETAKTEDFEVLAQGSLLPHEPQHNAQRNFSLTDANRHIRTL